MRSSPLGPFIMPPPGSHPATFAPAAAAAAPQHTRARPILVPAGLCAAWPATWGCPTTRRCASCTDRWRPCARRRSSTRVRGGGGVRGWRMDAVHGPEAVAAACTPNSCLIGKPTEHPRPTLTSSPRPPAPPCCAAQRPPSEGATAGTCCRRCCAWRARCRRSRCLWAAPRRRWWRPAWLSRRAWSSARVG